MPETARKRPDPSPIALRMAERLLTIPEFCTAARISERQYFRLQADGQGPRTTRLGGKVLIRVEAFEEWLDASTQTF